MSNPAKRRSVEYLQNTTSEYERGCKTAQLSLDLGKFAMYFSHIDRVPRYANGERENDAEHSFMLALVAPEIVEALELPLNSGRVSQYAVVHDLVELKTGDVATFLFSEDAQTEKEHHEHMALTDLLAELPPHTAATLANYESQADPESRFVRYVDKLLPVVVDVIGAGERVMREDYDVSSADALKQCQAELHRRLAAKFNGEFPELDVAHELLCELFQSKFEMSV